MDFRGSGVGKTRFETARLDKTTWASPCQYIRMSTLYVSDKPNKIWLNGHKYINISMLNM